MNEDREGLYVRFKWRSARGKEAERQRGRRWGWGGMKRGKGTSVCHRQTVSQSDRQTDSEKGIGIGMIQLRNYGTRDGWKYWNSQFFGQIRGSGLWRG